MWKSNEFTRDMEKKLAPSDIVKDYSRKPVIYFARLQIDSSVCSNRREDKYLLSVKYPDYDVAQSTLITLHYRYICFWGATERSMPS